MFNWLARPLKCKFGAHDLAKNIERSNPKVAVIRTICLKCDYTSEGISIALVDGKISAKDLAAKSNKCVCGFRMVKLSVQSTRESWIEYLACPLCGRTRNEVEVPINPPFINYRALDKFGGS